MTAATFNKSPPTPQCRGDPLAQKLDGLLDAEDVLLAAGSLLDLYASLGQGFRAHHHPERKADEICVVELDPGPLVPVVEDGCDAGLPELFVKRLRRLSLRGVGGIDDDQVHVIRGDAHRPRSEEHTSELQSRENLVCRLLLEK